MFRKKLLEGDDASTTCCKDLTHQEDLRSTKVMNRCPGEVPAPETHGNGLCNLCKPRSCCKSVDICGSWCVGW